MLFATQISEVARCPAVTTSGAVVEALKKLEVRKIALATPYIQEVTQREIDFLESSGFDMVNTKSLGLVENLKIGKLSLDDATSLAKSVNSELAQAVFISCTNFRTSDALPLLEEQLGKPVISSNSATLWACLKALGGKIQAGLGELFDV